MAIRVCVDDNKHTVMIINSLHEYTIFLVRVCVVLMQIMQKLLHFICICSILVYYTNW